MGILLLAPLISALWIKLIFAIVGQASGFCIFCGSMRYLPTMG